MRDVSSFPILQQISFHEQFLLIEASGVRWQQYIIFTPTAFEKHFVDTNRKQHRPLYPKCCCKNNLSYRSGSWSGSVNKFPGDAGLYVLYSMDVWNRESVSSNLVI